MKKLVFSLYRELGSATWCGPPGDRQLTRRWTRQWLCLGSAWWAGQRVLCRRPGTPPPVPPAELSAGRFCTWCPPLAAVSGSPLQTEPRVTRDKAASAREAALCKAQGQAHLLKQLPASAPSHGALHTLPSRHEQQLKRSSLSCGINEWFAHWS